MNTPEPGIYSNIPFSEYRSWDAANNSTLKLFTAKTPAHVKQHLDYPPLATPALIFGKLLHKLILEPEKFGDDFLVCPKVDRRTKDGKIKWQEFLESAEGKIVVTQDDYDTAGRMAKAAFSHPEAIQCLQDGEPEVSVAWVDKDTGILCKARMDYVHWDFGVVADLKSVRSANPYIFSKAILDYAYYQQAAFYRDGLDAISENDPSFVFVAIEKEPPFVTAIYELNTESIIVGRKAYKEALSKYAECKLTGEWPGYPELQGIDIPTWAIRNAGINAETEVQYA